MAPVRETARESLLASGTGVFSTTPVAASGIGDAIQVSAGGQHTCALRMGNVVSCWGDDSAGQLGDGRSGMGVLSAVPVAVTGASGVASIAAGYSSTCALLPVAATL